jgi:type 1 fimbria pilin
MKMITTALLTLALLLAGATAQAQDRIRTGNFEIKVNGLPVAGRCYSAREVKMFNADARTLRSFQEQGAAKRNCSLKDFNVAGNKISFTLVCADHTTTTAGTYHGDSFETVTTVAKGREVTTTHVEGRRTGDCH